MWHVRITLIGMQTAELRHFKFVFELTSVCATGPNFTFAARQRLKLIAAKLTHSISSISETLQRKSASNMVAITSTDSWIKFTRDVKQVVQSISCSSSSHRSAPCLHATQGFSRDQSRVFRVDWLPRGVAIPREIWNRQRLATTCVELTSNSNSASAACRIL